MTDRELLALAAKAAGVELVFSTNFDAGIPPRLKGTWDAWNPLNYDGDALRLAVKLRLPISFGANYVIVDCEQAPTVNNANDPYLAIRSAIVRAAAAIGEAMP